MSNVDKTPLSNKCDILAEFWIQYQDVEEFAEFVQYNDLGLPIAYAVSNGIIEASERATLFIEETFATLMWALSGQTDMDSEYDEIVKGDSEAWMAQEFETIEDVFMFFGTGTIK